MNVLLLTALMIVLQSAQTAKTPKLVVDKEAIDLGVLYGGETKASRLILRNSGRDTLKIQNVQASCGCTTVKHPRAFLLPGQSDSLQVSFNSMGLMGKVTRQVTIRSNDPARPSLTVPIRADVKYELEPVGHAFNVSFGNIPIGVETEKKISFRNSTEHQIVVKQVQSGKSSISAEAAQHSVDPGMILDIIVKATPSKVGPENSVIVVETSSKKQPRFNVRIVFSGVKKDS